MPQDRQNSLFFHDWSMTFAIFFQLPIDHFLDISCNWLRKFAILFQRLIDEIVSFVNVLQRRNCKFRQLIVEKKKKNSCSTDETCDFCSQLTDEIYNFFSMSDWWNSRFFFCDTLTKFTIFFLWMIDVIHYFSAYNWRKLWLYFVLDLWNSQFYPRPISKL